MRYAKTITKTLTKAPQNNYLPTADVCRVEYNTILIPFFTFGTIIIKDKNGNKIKVREGSTEGIIHNNVIMDGKKVSYNINFDYKYGRPGEKDFILFRKIEEIAVGYITRGEIIPEYMYVGTAQSLDKNLRISDIDKFLGRIIGTRLRGEAVFFQTDGGTDDATKKATGKLVKCTDGISLYDGSRIVSKVEDKNINNESDNDVVGIYVKLSDYYKKNLNNYYTKPIFGKYLNCLERGISRRILEILLLKDMNENAVINYLTLCDHLQIHKHNRQWEMRRQIKGIISELEEKKLVIWKNHKNPTKINGGTDWQLFFSLRPLMTPLQRRRQLDFEGNMKETDIIKILKRKDIIRLNTNKTLKTSPIEDMVANAIVEELNNKNKVQLKKLGSSQVKAIIKSKKDKKSHSKIECYDEHLIPSDYVEPPVPAPIPISNEYDEPF